MGDIPDIIRNGTLRAKQEVIKSQQLQLEHIDLILDLDQESLFENLIYNQQMSEIQHLRILSHPDYETLRDRIECYRDEHLLPLEVIETVINDETYKFAKSAISSNYPLSQKHLKQILSEETDFWEIIGIIEYQGLSSELVTYLYYEKINELPLSDNEKLKSQEKLREYLMFNQTIPDDIIEEIIEANEKTYNLIHGQRLSNRWILRILSDVALINHHYELIRMQTMDEEVADYIFSMKENSPLFSLVRLQNLSDRHIERALKTGYESIIVGVLETQEFSTSKQEELMKRFPQYEDLINSKLTANSTFWNLFNMRLRRDGRLQSHLDFLSK